MSVASEFKTTKQLVLYALERFPETRSSDNQLYVQCARLLGATTLEDLDKIGFNLVSMHKVRQKIQNKEGLFLPNEDVQLMRQKRAVEVKQFILNN